MSFVTFLHCTFSEHIARAGVCCVQLRETASVRGLCFRKDMLKILLTAVLSAGIVRGWLSYPTLPFLGLASHPEGAPFSVVPVMMKTRSR